MPGTTMLDDRTYALNLGLIRKSSIELMRCKFETYDFTHVLSIETKANTQSNILVAAQFNKRHKIIVGKKTNETCY